MLAVGKFFASFDAGVGHIFTSFLFFKFSERQTDRIGLQKSRLWATKLASLGGAPRLAMLRL
jgi:hypothetical protein